ncbi:MAG: hypothetical protein Q9225_006954 [Loekoesia sp. 1 TL-2023]
MLVNFLVTSGINGRASSIRTSRLYNYTPLADQSIRLLTLLPGTLDDDIRLGILSTKLAADHPPVYDALSYAWGNPNDVDVVYIVSDGSCAVLPINQSLCTALKYLRSTSTSLTLWIDAICIDQHNIKERNIQVARMADIYTLAAKVLIWLGPEADGSTTALQALRHTSSEDLANWGSHTSAMASASTYPRCDDYYKRFSFNDETWTSLVRLLNRSWFRRLWIWQEVFLGQRHADVICGHEIVAWQDFRRAIICIHRRQMPAWIPSLHAAVSQAWEICETTNQQPLPMVLRRTRKAQCSDPRDRIFGILSLTKDLDRLGIRPDYEKTTLDVFREVIIGAAQKFKNLQLLARCELVDGRSDMPSWIPNWSTPHDFNAIDGKACWNSTSEVRYIRYTDGDEHLIVAGHRVSTIIISRSIVPDDPLACESLESLTRLREIYATFRKLVLGIKAITHRNFEYQAETMLRTIFCNSFADNVEPMVATIQMKFDVVLQRFRRIQNLSLHPCDNCLEETADFLNEFYNSAVGRALIYLETGHLGLGPKRCFENTDVVAIILGCQTPMVLRPRKNRGHVVVGECYVQGLMEGEAFLGPLPGNGLRAYRFVDGSSTSYDAFIDRENETLQIEDPRLGALPQGWIKQDHDMQHVCDLFRNVAEGWASSHDPRMTLQALRERGIKFEDFHLA